MSSRPDRRYQRRNRAKSGAGDDARADGAAGNAARREDQAALAKASEDKARVMAELRAIAGSAWTRADQKNLQR